MNAIIPRLSDLSAMDWACIGVVGIGLILVVAFYLATANAHVTDLSRTEIIEKVDERFEALPRISKHSHEDNQVRTREFVQLPDGRWIIRP